MLFIVHALYLIHLLFLKVASFRKRETDFVHVSTGSVVRGFLHAYGESSDSMGTVRAYRNAVAAVFANRNVRAEMDKFSKLEIVVDKLYYLLQGLSVGERLRGDDSEIGRIGRSVQISMHFEELGRKESAKNSSKESSRLREELISYDEWKKSWQSSRNGRWWALEWVWAEPRQVPRIEEREIWQLTPDERAHGVSYLLDEEAIAEEEEAKRKAASTACAICGASADLWW